MCSAARVISSAVSESDGVCTVRCDVDFESVPVLHAYPMRTLR